MTKSNSLHNLDIFVKSLNKFLEALFKAYLKSNISEIQEDIAHFLQHGPRLRMIQAFRGIGKSQITCGYVLWRLLNNPNLRILIVSASKYKAEDISLNILKMIESCSILSAFKSKQDRWQRRRASLFDISGAGYAKDPSVVSLGIASQLTGSRAHLIVADDVEVPSNSQTAHQRQKLLNQVLEFPDILYPGGEIIYLGTPQSTDSIYFHLQHYGVCVRIWPAEFPDNIEPYYNDSREQMLGDFILKGYANKQYGMPTEPNRFGLEELKHKRKSRGALGYSMQYLLNVSDQQKNRHPLNIEHIAVLPKEAPKLKVPSRFSLSDNRVYGLGDSFDQGYPFRYVALPSNFKWIDVDDCILSIDPAGGGFDSTAVCVIAISGKQFFLLDTLCLQEKLVNESLRIIANLAYEYQVSTVVIESNFGQDLLSLLLEPLFKPGFQPKLVSKRANQNKQARLGGILDPIISNQRLVFSYTVLCKDAKLDTLRQLSHQIKTYSPSYRSLKFDDLLDSLAQGLNYLSNHIKSHKNKQHLDDTLNLSIWQDEIERWGDDILN